MWQFFSTIWCISGVASFLDNPNAIISEYYSFSTFKSCSPNLTSESFKYPLISSWSLRFHVSKSPQVSSFIFQFFPVNYAFVTFIFNSYGGSFKSSLSLVIISIHSLFPNSTGGWWRFSKVCAISILILSMRISSMPNLLLVINLNWWRISIM